MYYRVIAHSKAKSKWNTLFYYINTDLHKKGCRKTGFKLKFRCQSLDKNRPIIGSLSKTPILSPKQASPYNHTHIENCRGGKTASNLVGCGSLSHRSWPQKIVVLSGYRTRIVFSTAGSFLPPL